MKIKPIHQLVLSGVFIAIGVVLPIAFHAIGGAGAIFLPMHIPVLVAGFFLNIPYAAAVGILTPLLSSLFTGMPPVFPMLPIMMVELPVYAIVISLLTQKTKLNLFIKLLVAMAGGRIAAGGCVYVLATFFSAKLPGPDVFIKGSVVTGLPGIGIQLLLIPAVIVALDKFMDARHIQTQD
ncbi:ECF transporter S component [Fusibacter tunisiensis]|uniref:ECF transporter S component n=1 Tax=Fusibacter tunisiensis TaxID=1008308 RepID=A0ABS2MTR2_9FIRM|nr:ECF transporter S component [Fusibacter tunisiensis]MBM7562784.1 hypothetical protein [Fusibacter tunisiensis]